MMNRKMAGPYFFGWRNIKWFLREVMKIYSAQASYFSKKRIESGVAFIIGQIGMIWYFFIHYSTMTSEDMGIWAAIEFAIAGYTTYQIQRQKKNDYSDYNNYSNSYGSTTTTTTMAPGGGPPDVPDEPSETNQVT